MCFTEFDFCTISVIIDIPIVIAKQRPSFHSIFKKVNFWHKKYITIKTEWVFKIEWYVLNKSYLQLKYKK